MYAIRSYYAPDVIMIFPGGICRAGSKAGSLKYKLKASTNHPYCPTLRTIVPDTVVPEGVQCVYEIVINGLSLDAVKKGIKEGVTAAIDIPGVVKISSGNYRITSYNVCYTKLLRIGNLASYRCRNCCFRANKVNFSILSSTTPLKIAVKCP